MSKLTAISPIDGRYQKQTASLSAYFSEFGLIKYRVMVEVHYFLFLADKILAKQMLKKLKRSKLLPTMMLKRLNIF
jgi:adenylosuccinate lyase